jgi:photosystem II stability/assembly factor-like uncharacterized protein
VLAKTTNSGTTWVTTYLGTTSNICAMKFVDANNGYAIEDYSATGNKLYKTTNGGNTWQAIPTGFNESINTICFVNSNLGYIGGGGWTSSASIYKTTNGGTSWVKQTINTTYSILSICARDTVAWAVGGDGVILRTINHGAAWITIAAGSLSLPPFYSVDFFTYKTGGTDHSVGMAVGYTGMAKRSTDFGTSWTTIMSDWVEYKTLYDIQMIDSTYGYAVGAKGKMMKTTDGGLTWVHQNSGMRGELWSVSFGDSLHGAAVGDSAINSSGYADGKIYSTSDGGNSWRETSFPYSTIKGVHFVNANFGCAVGYNGINAISARTTDGGNSWALNSINGFRGKLWSVDFQNTLNGVAVGDSGVVMRTGDGGVTWSRINSGTTNALWHTIYSPNLFPSVHPDTVKAGYYAAGAGGKLLMSEDGGTWTNVPFPGTGAMYGISVVLNKAVYIAASDGIYKSSSPNVYNKLTSPGFSPNAVWALTENQACTVANYGGIAVTANGGGSWAPIKITTNSLHSIFMLNSKTAWIVGETGTVLKTNSFTITGIEPQKTDGSIPVDFNLSQNYPNPFNPYTRIDYQVTCDSKIIIELYNIKGQKVASLVNQDQKAGHYSFGVNSATLKNVSSGVYFYRMTAISKTTGKNYCNTKKMILLK